MSQHRPPLGPVSLLALGVNGIVGVGIFLAPPSVARAFPGTAGALVYLAMAVACLPIALVYARLSRALPSDGGPALYALHAFGPRTASAIGGLVWVSALFSAAAVTRALAERLAHARFTSAVAIALSLALALINLRSLKLSSWMWTALTIAKLAPMLSLAALGVLAPASQSSALESAPTHRGAAILAVLFALQGFEIVPLPAGQARDPERNVPRATVAALLVAGALYGLVHLACVRALPSLAASGSPIPDAAATLGGVRLAHAIGVGVIASMGGIVVGMHAMTPRYLAAITHERAAEVPVRSIIASAVVIAALCMFSSLPELLDLASIAVLAQYASASAALVVLARRRQVGLLPREAWPAPLALAVAGVLLAQASARELAVAAAVAIAGVLVARVLTRPPG